MKKAGVHIQIDNRDLLVDASLVFARKYLDDSFLYRIGAGNTLHSSEVLNVIYINIANKIKNEMGKKQ